VNPKYEINDLKLRISKAKMTLFTRGKGTTFFSALLSSLRIEITEDISTASIDGSPCVSISSFHPSPIQLLGLMMHELGHMIFDHIAGNFKQNSGTLEHGRRPLHQSLVNTLASNFHRCILR
jgi:hypothetical protein